MRNDGAPAGMREVNGDPSMNITQMLCPDTRQPPRTDTRPRPSSPTATSPSRMEIAPSSPPGDNIQGAGSTVTPVRVRPPTHRHNWGSARTSIQSRPSWSRHSGQSPAGSRSPSPTGWTYIPSPRRPSSPNGWGQGGWRG